MKLLSELSPAETLLIIEKGKSKLSHLAQYTFLDLCSQQILKINGNSAKMSSGKKTLKNTTISIGKKFGKTKPKQHEIPFLSIFAKTRDLKLAFTSLIKLSYKRMNGDFKFRKTVISNEKTKLLFKESILFNLFNSTPLNTLGLEVRDQIQDYLKEADAYLIQNGEKDEKRLNEILMTLQGNIVFLKNFKPELIEEFNLEKITSNGTSFEYYHDLTWWSVNDDYHDFNDYDNDWHDFDSGFDSSFDSGCSSCSGCGGCGGCGGCS